MLSSRITILLVAIVSLALLIPGLTKPMITLQADLNRHALVQEGKRIIQEQKINPAITAMATQFLDGLKVEGSSKVYDKTRSILGTAQDLWRSGYGLVAVLIVLFSAVIPGIKALILLCAAALKQPQALLKVNSWLSKWSMADVFAIGVLIACLAANASSSQSSIINFQASLHDGFYWFVAYCLVSAALAQIINRQPAPKEASPN